MDSAFIPAAKPLIGDEEVAAVERVLRSGMLAQGPEVAAFEAEFADQFLQGRTAVAVNSGTSGQLLGLIASGVGPGDEVIVPSFTFAAVANSVVLAGATPVFVDIEPVHFTLDPARVREAITPRTKGIMPVHLYGHPFLVDEIEAVAAEHGLAIYEDAAQAHGAAWRGRPAGTIGAFGMFSLYPTKNMTAIEGGIVACADEDIARTVRLLRNQGMETQYANEIVGYNNRMSEVHAAVGRVQLRKVGSGPGSVSGMRRCWMRRSPASTGSRSRGSPTAPSTCITSTRCASPGASATGCEMLCVMSTRSGRASTTRSPTIGCPRCSDTPPGPTCPRPSGRRRRCSRSRCTRRSRARTSTGSSTVSRP